MTSVKGRATVVRPHGTACARRHNPHQLLFPVMNPLRKMFGPSKGEIWRQLCAATGADYVQGGFWKGDQVQATHG